jgi:hypothetical protein
LFVICNKQACANGFWRNDLQPVLAEKKALDGLPGKMPQAAVQVAAKFYASSL